MGINKSTVYNWIKAQDKKLEKQKEKQEEEKTQKIIEMDELYSYTTHKKTELT